jgi:hypothetical protein
MKIGINQYQAMAAKNHQQSHQRHQSIGNGGEIVSSKKENGSVSEENEMK